MEGPRFPLRKENDGPDLPAASLIPAAQSSPPSVRTFGRNNKVRSMHLQLSVFTDRVREGNTMTPLPPRDLPASKAVSEADQDAS
jgi:hypothetical protein